MLKPKTRWLQKTSKFVRSSARTDDLLFSCLTARQYGCDYIDSDQHRRSSSKEVGRLSQDTTTLGQIGGTTVTITTTIATSKMGPSLAKFRVCVLSFRVFSFRFLPSRSTVVVSGVLSSSFFLLRFGSLGKTSNLFQFF